MIINKLNTKFVFILRKNYDNYKTNLSRVLLVALSLLYFSFALAF